MKVLVELGADVDSVDANGDTMLHKAVAKRHAEAVAALVALGADVRAQDARGRTALQHDNAAQPRVRRALAAAVAAAVRSTRPPPSSSSGGLAV